MRNEILRDVLAGCAGVLAVMALIGLPKDPAPAGRPQVRMQWQQEIRLLPVYSSNLRSPWPFAGPRVGPPGGPAIPKPPAAPVPPKLPAP